MKNVIEILKALGIEVAEDKTAELNKAVSTCWQGQFEFYLCRLKANIKSLLMQPT